MGQFASQAADKQLLGAGLCSPTQGRPEDQQKDMLDIVYRAQCS